MLTITYNKQKNFIPEKYFTLLFDKNKNWIRVINTVSTNINFLYNYHTKDLYNIHSDISNLFTPSHRQYITNKANLIKTVIKYEPENYKKYMLPSVIIDINDIQNLQKYKKLFKKILILRPTWGYNRSGIHIFSNFKDFAKYMKNNGIDELNKTISKVGTNGIKYKDTIKYVLSEYLQDQMMYDGWVFNIRVFFLITCVKNISRGYLIKPLIVHLAKKKKSNNLNDVFQHISSDIDYFFDDTIEQKKQKYIIRQIKHILSFIFKIINNNKIMEIYPGMDNAFELFGVDFIISNNSEVKLIEINDRVGIYGYSDIVYQSIVNGIINGTINKLYDKIYKIKIDKTNIIRIK